MLGPMSCRKELLACAGKPFSLGLVRKANKLHSILRGPDAGFRKQIGDKLCIPAGIDDQGRRRNEVGEPGVDAARCRQTIQLLTVAELRQHMLDDPA